MQCVWFHVLYLCAGLLRFKLRITCLQSWVVSALKCVQWLFGAGHMVSHEVTTVGGRQQEGGGSGTRTLLPQNQQKESDIAK